MIKIILFFILQFFQITISQSTKCFSVYSNHNLSSKETVLSITGSGKMCDCLKPDDTFSSYLTTVTSLSFSDSVISIGNGCFRDFSALKTITFGKGIEEIREYSFYHSSIEQLTIPSNVKLIQSYAFSNSLYLQTISFEENDKNELIIESFAFTDCKKLTSIHLPKQLKQFNPLIVDGCISLKTFIYSSKHSPVCHGVAKIFRKVK